MSADGRIVAFENHSGNLVNGQDNLGYIDVFARDLTSGQTQLASQRTPLFPDWRLKNTISEFDSASADGRFVSFRSGGVVYVRDRDTNQVTAESLLPNGTIVSVSNFRSGLSADGRFLAFASARNLATAGPPNTTNQNQVWIRDRETGQTRLASLNAAGQASAGGLWEFVFSQDGRYVAFSSEASDLVSGFVDGNGNGFGVRDLYLHGLVAGVTRLVSHVPGSLTTSGNGASFSPIYSDHSSKLVFLSRASNLQANTLDTNADDDIFAYNVVSGALGLVSANVVGTGTGNRRSESPVVSGDGRYVAFSSAASDLSAQDTPRGLLVMFSFAKTNTTVLASLNEAGLLSGAGHSLEPSISSDGRYLAFISDANDLVAGDSGQRDVLVRDMQTGVTTRASLAVAGGQPNGASNSPRISPDGRFLSFTSLATNLVANFVDGNGSAGADLFVRDLSANITDLVTVSHLGTTSGNVPVGSGIAAGRQFAADGQTLFFTGEASNLVNGDRNSTNDVFAYKFGGAGQIRGQIFHDTDKSGSPNAGEPSIAAWTVYLDANGNGRLDSNERNVQTDAGGNYAFTGLAVGTYTVTLMLVDGFSRTFPASAGTYTVTLDDAQHEIRRSADEAFPKRNSPEFRMGTEILANSATIGMNVSNLIGATYSRSTE